MIHSRRVSLAILRGSSSQDLQDAIISCSNSIAREARKAGGLELLHQSSQPGIACCCRGDNQNGYDSEEEERRRQQEEEDEEDYFKPETGNVAFASAFCLQRRLLPFLVRIHDCTRGKALPQFVFARRSAGDGWAFTLGQFAALYAAKMGGNPRALQKVCLLSSAAYRLDLSWHACHTCLNMYSVQQGCARQNFELLGQWIGDFVMPNQSLAICSLRRCGVTTHIRRRRSASRGCGRTEATAAARCL